MDINIYMYSNDFKGVKLPKRDESYRREKQYELSDTSRQDQEELKSPSKAIRTPEERKKHLKN